MYGLMMWEAHMHSFFFSVCQVLLKMGGLKKICNLCYLCQEIYFLWLLRLYISFQSLYSNQNYVLEDTFNLPCQQQRNHPSKKLELLTQNFFCNTFSGYFQVLSESRMSGAESTTQSLAKMRLTYKLTCRISKFCGRWASGSWQRYINVSLNVGRISWQFQQNWVL